MKNPAAVVQSVFDFAIREINALETASSRPRMTPTPCSGNRPARWWRSSRPACHNASSPRSGSTRGQVSPTRKCTCRSWPELVREKLTFQPRPVFREAYNEIANSGASKVDRLLHQTGDYRVVFPARYCRRGA